MQKALTGCISCLKNCLVGFELISGGALAHLRLLPNVGRHSPCFPQVLRSGGAPGRGEERRGVGSESVAAEEEAKLGWAGKVTIGLRQLSELESHSCHSDT